MKTPRSSWTAEAPLWRRRRKVREPSAHLNQGNHATLLNRRERLAMTRLFEIAPKM
jgi:hypothetical protein